MLYTSLIISRQSGDGPLEDVSFNKFFDPETLEFRCGKADEYHEWHYHNGLAQKHFVVRCKRPPVKPFGEDVDRSEFAETVTHWINMAARRWSLVT